MNFLLMLMKKWKTSLHVSAPNKSISINLINILSGLFQDHCPTVLLFILCLLPLSWLIKEPKIGYSVGRKSQRILVSHLLFTDDIKLYARNIRQFQNLLEIISKFSNDIRINFGLDKCIIFNILKGKLTPSEDIDFPAKKLSKLSISEINVSTFVCSNEVCRKK